MVCGTETDSNNGVWNTFTFFCTFNNYNFEFIFGQHRFLFGGSSIGNSKSSYINDYKMLCNYNF